jgi:sugar/nucleoside kinase (ribokinase family)
LNFDPVRVLCIGILVADIFVPRLDRLPEAGELVATDDFLIAAGGCAANVAVALGKLGVQAGVSGRIGDDLFGEIVTRDLRSRDIDTRGILPTAGVGTSKTVILPVAQEDRRYVHTFGANAELTVADVEQSSLDGVEVVYVGGYFALPQVRADELAPRLQAARNAGAIVVLDVATPAGQEICLDDVRPLLPALDYFIPNVDEGRALTGESEPRRQAERLIDYGASTVVIKRGARGVYAQSRNEELEVSAPHIEVVEPSGAGDAFAAGLILGALEGWSLRDDLRFGCAVGASACRALGCSAGVFTREEAEAFVDGWAT